MMIDMTDDSNIKKIYTAFFEHAFPVDLKLIVIWLLISILAIYLPLLNIPPLRIILSLPILLFIPGYCLIAVLYPKKHEIEFIERIALSFGISIAVVPLISYGLNFTPWGIRVDSVVISLTVLILALILVAHYRRALFPSKERFSMSFSEIAGSLREAFFPAGSILIDRALSVVLILVILVAITTTIYVIVSPKETEHFSEFFIVGEKGMAADYPDQLVTGLQYPMFIGVGNHEYRNVTYTIETWAALTEFDNVTISTSILVIDPLDRQSFVLSHNETRVIPYTLSLNKTGYNRIEFLLFNESVPGPEVSGSDRINASFRDLYLLISVSQD
jgi:uncharacterized membrane protein